MSDEVILEAFNLTKHFPTGASKLLQRPTQVVQAVDGVSLSLRRGTTLAVVGESGCGKSTLARLLARLIEPTAGSVILNGVNLTSASSKEMLKMRRDIQVVFQDPYACLNPRHSIGQSIGTPIRIQKTMSRTDERHRVFELLDLDEYKVYFPLLKSRDRLIAHDHIWQKICDYLHWEFIRSV